MSLNKIKNDDAIKFWSKAHGDSNRISCKCGHTIAFRYDQTYVVCKCCGRLVFKTEKDEFIYKLKKEINCQKIALEPKKIRLI